MKFPPVSLFSQAISSHCLRLHFMGQQWTHETPQISWQFMGQQGTQETLRISWHFMGQEGTQETPLIWWHFYGTTGKYHGFHDPNWHCKCNSNAWECVKFPGLVHHTTLQYYYTFWRCKLHNLHLTVTATVILTEILKRNVTITINCKGNCNCNCICNCYCNSILWLVLQLQILYIRIFHTNILYSLLKIYLFPRAVWTGQIAWI